jgi:hypothetical protein
MKNDQLMPRPLRNKPLRLRKPLDAEGVPLGGKGKISMEEFAEVEEKPDETRTAELLRRLASAGEATGRHRRLGGSAPSLPPAELLSFLKETRGLPTWRVQDLAKTLNVSTAVAKQATAFCGSGIC